MNNYNFSLSQKVYNALVNKTVFQSGAQLNVDEISSLITLPFPFAINGIAHTQVFICNNGYLGFGSLPTSSKAKNVFGAISSSDISCPSLISFSNQIIPSSVGNPEISYGQNLNGDFVVQFQDVSIQTAPAVRMTFQMVLKLDGLTIEIVFGDNCTGQDQISNISVRSFEVGVRFKQTPRVGATNYTALGDACNLVLVSGNWNKSTDVKKGTRASSGMSVRTGVNIPPQIIPNMIQMPLSGLTYEWKL